ncbi:MAG: response regulator, partial [bacterium]|nr:response regulator [bacterium]
MTSSNTLCHWRPFPLSVTAQIDPISIVLVEDDAAARANIAEILAAAGMIVDQAVDGAVGLQRAGSGHHDVIVLDRMLPHLSGIDVVTRMRV